MAFSTKQRITTAAHISSLSLQTLPSVILCSKHFAALFSGRHRRPMMPSILQNGARCVSSPLLIWLTVPVDEQVASPTCGTCGLAPPRPFVCLDCAFFACWQDDHILDHLKDDNHRFCTSTCQPFGSFLKLHSGVDTQLGVVFCKECQDMIYDPSLDNIYQKIVLAIEERETKLLGSFTFHSPSEYLLS
jgi:Zn-finger in ubiquitin-hydrolases and other protein